MKNFQRTVRPRIRQASNLTIKVAPSDFVPIANETRERVSTAVAAWHLSLQQQTLRAHASAQTYDPRLKPVRAHGRLLWPVAGIKSMLGVAA